MPFSQMIFPVPAAGGILTLRMTVPDYDNDAYRIFVDKEDWMAWANPGESFDGDVVITVDSTKIGGVDDNDIGVICRYVDADNFYLLKFSSDGYAQVAKYSNGEYVGISSEQMDPVDGVNAGETLNKVRAECVGEQLNLYVNDNLVASGTDADFASGDVGLYAGTFGTAGTDVSFDNFEVNKP
jgi:hypothetical protein